MAPDVAGLIGVQMPWQRVVGVGMRVDSFTSFSQVVDGRVVKGGVLPAKAVATVELFLNTQAARDEVGADSIWLQLPIEHDDDMLVFYWIFEERDLGDDEEVTAMYMPALGLFAGSKARLAVAITPKGTLRRTFEAVQRGEFR